MLKKRIIGVVTVKNSWAVQSFGYGRYLPLGKPEYLIENLDRWGADEILIQVIDRSINDMGPDLELLYRVGCLGLETPLIYSGGVRNVEDARKVIQSGADRIVVDHIIHSDCRMIASLSKHLGAQAIIAALPLSFKNGKIKCLDYFQKKIITFPSILIDLIEQGSISEILIIDWKHEGNLGDFDIELINNFPLDNVPLIIFGGLTKAEQMRMLLQKSNVSAIAIGNRLNYCEHAIQNIKSLLAGMPLRPPSFA